ncbi:AI-2E family transporter [Catellatospora methionotrophica]|uniref:AI-2E family transporter n=2 Tax=Catellatospora methionotrophica TaxID=121620 RepID=UPI0027E52D7F|nr:AI-2E family transporter [Catellatospora methionotrophica]
MARAATAVADATITASLVFMCSTIYNNRSIGMEPRFAHVARGHLLRVRTGRITAGQVFRWAAAAACGVTAVGLGLIVLWTVRGVLALVLVALFVAVSLDPAVRWLVRHRVRRPVAVGMILLVALAALAGLVIGVGPPLVRQAGQLVADLPGYIGGLDERSPFFRELSLRYGLDDRLNELAAAMPQWVATNLLGMFQTFMEGLVTTVTVVVLALYFLADMPRLRRRAQLMAPDRHRERVRRIVDTAVDKVGSYMIGNAIVSLIAGVVAYIGLLIFDVPFALPLALIVAVTDLIPLVGATLGMAICGVVAAIAVGLWPAAIAIVVWLLVYQQIENYWIVPLVMRRSMDMPSLSVLLAGLVGVAVLGLVGALMAIPIAATIKAVIAELRIPLPPPGYAVDHPVDDPELSELAAQEESPATA